MKKQPILLIALLVLTLALSACQSAAPTGSSAPEAPQISAFAADTPAQASGTEVSEQESAPQAGSESSAEAEPIPEAFLPVEYDHPEFTLVMDPQDIPEELRSQMLTLYPRGILVSLKVQYIVPGQNEDRWVDFFVRPGEEGYQSTRMKDGETMGMYTLRMYSADEKSVVDAHYESLGPDEYVTYMTGPDRPYPLFHRAGGEGGHIALVETNRRPEPHESLSTGDPELADAGYQSRIYAACEWVPN